MLNVVNQDSGFLLIMAFYDNYRRPVTPATATYKITDVNSITTLKEETAIVDLAQKIELEIPPEVNDLINEKLDLEPKAITVTYSYWNGRATVVRVSEFQYVVARMYGKVTNAGAI